MVNRFSTSPRQSSGISSVSMIDQKHLNIELLEEQQNEGHRPRSSQCWLPFSPNRKREISRHQPEMVSLKMNSK